MAHLIPKFEAPKTENYIHPDKCPDVPKIKIKIAMVTKLKKLALNHRGIPKPPELGYTVTYPIPTM